MLLYATLSLSQSVICPLVFLSNRLVYELEYILFTSKHGILIKECYRVKIFFFHFFSLGKLPKTSLEGGCFNLAAFVSKMATPPSFDQNFMDPP